MSLLQAIKDAFGLVPKDTRGWITAYVLSAFVASALEASGLAGLFVFFHVALTPENAGLTGFAASLSDMLGAPPRPTLLTILAVAATALFLCRAALLMGIVWLGVAFRRRLQEQLTHRVFRAYLAQPLEWHMRMGQSRLATNIASNIGQVAQHMIVAALDVFASAVLIAMVLLTLMYVQPVGTLLALVLVVVSATFFLRIMRPLLQRWGMDNVEIQSALYRAVRDPLRGIKTVKVFGNGELFARDVDRATAASMALQVRRSLVQQAPRLVLEALVVIAVLGSVIAAIQVGVSLSVIVPSMALFAAAAIRLIPHATAILGHIQYMRMTEAPLAALREDVKGLSPRLPTGAVAAGSAATFRSLALQGISFRYSGSERDAPTLQDVSLELRKGELVALAGPSGAGKTTLVDILLGLLPPTSGTMLLNDARIDAIPHGLFSYVPQESFVVYGTLRDNVTLGLERVPDADVVDTLNRAGLGNLLARLPQGIHTTISEDGSGLSGGEKQRIAIARALLRDTPVLVLDEPTSALDALTEAAVIDAIKGLRGVRTVIVIAHRLSSVQSFDRIVVMSQGRVTGQGSFAHVYQTNTEFARMVDVLALDMGDRVRGGAEQA